MKNDEFSLKLPLFDSLIECGKLLQRREDAIARIHAAQAELKTAQAAFHRLEQESLTASLAVTKQYQTFYPFNWDETDNVSLGF